MRVLDLITNENGQTTVLAALSLISIIAFIGLAIDGGSLWYSQHQLHMAAEAAALAGALEVQSCVGVSNCGAMQAAAQSSLSENGFTNNTLLTNCSGVSATGLTLMLNNPPCFQGLADPNTGRSQYVEAVVSAQASTNFMRLIGINHIPISARAEAIRTGNPNCIYALDSSNAGAITVAALASLNANCGVIDESSSSSAFACDLLAGVHATKLRITGGLQTFLCNATPGPTTNSAIPTPADPLAWLPKPLVPSCGNSVSSPYNGSPVPLLIVGTATLYPTAAYCGGIILLPTANVTFMPGTYVIKSGGLLGLQGGISIDLGSRVNGSGVTFYNYGPIGGVTFVASSVTLGQVSLYAPTSGAYAGILFFQDSINTTPDVILANSSWNTTLEGAFYFPGAPVTCALTGAGRYNILVAKDIGFVLLSFPLGTLSNSTFSNNYTSLLNGSPLAGGGAALVQ